MSAHEWKPGDVIADEGGCVFFVIEGEDDTLRGIDASGADWYLSTIEGTRTLVVIDPEDREQMERLLGAYNKAERNAACKGGECGSGSCWIDIMRNALREFAHPKPPKPAEPTGLGAVVEDDKGKHYVRVADAIDGWAAGRQWQRIGGEINSVRNFGWDSLAIVRVLSDGWAGEDR